MQALLADPSPTLIRILERLLERAGFTEVVAVSRADAAREHLEAAEEALPALFVTAWDLPDRSGPDLVRYLRSRDATATLPVLMVSGRSSRREVLQAVEAGVGAYLLHPFSDEAFLERVAALLPGPENAAVEASGKDAGQREPRADAGSVTETEAAADREDGDFEEEEERKAA